MKKLIIGLTLLASISSFASNNLKMLDEVELTSYGQNSTAADYFQNWFIINPKELKRRTVSTIFNQRTMGKIARSTRLICTSRDIENCQSFRIVEATAEHKKQRLIVSAFNKGSLSKEDVELVYNDLAAQIKNSTNTEKFNPEYEELYSEGTRYGFHLSMEGVKADKPILGIASTIITVPLGMIFDAAIFVPKYIGNTLNTRRGKDAANEVAKNLEEGNSVLELTRNEYNAVNAFIKENIENL